MNLELAVSLHSFWDKTGCDLTFIAYLEQAGVLRKNVVSCISLQNNHSYYIVHRL